MTMGGGLLWYLVVAALVIIPFWHILPRHEVPKWFAFIALIPVGVIILLWIVAFRDRLGDRTRG